MNETNKYLIQVAQTEIWVEINPEDLLRLREKHALEYDERPMSRLCFVTVKPKEADPFPRKPCLTYADAEAELQRNEQSRRKVGLLGDWSTPPGMFDPADLARLQNVSGKGSAEELESDLAEIAKALDEA